MVRWPAIRRPPEWGVAAVPPEARAMRTVDFLVLWFSLGVGLLVLAAGALLVTGFGLTLVEVVPVAILGSLFGSFLLVAAAVPGMQNGVPTMVSLRPVLGTRGSYVPTGLNVLQLLGWAAFELLIMGLAGAQLVGPVLGPWTSLALIPAFGVVVGLLAVGGPIAVVRTWLERFAIWLVVGSTVWIAVQIALRPVDWHDQLTFAPDSSSFLIALDLVIVMPVSWWPLAADYNRFARRGRDGTRGTLAGYSLANSAFFVLGAVLQVVAIKEGRPDFVAAIATLNLGFFALLFILVDETDNAFADVYSTAVSLQNAFSRAKQLPFIVAGTGVAVALAVYLQLLYPDPTRALESGYQAFLFLIGGLFVPLLGILAADHFVVRRGAYRADEFSGHASSFRAAAFVAWAPSALLYLAIVGRWLPWVPPTGATLPSFATAAVLYLGVSWAASRARASAVAR